MKVMRHWHRLPRDVCGCASLEVLKAGLDARLSTLVYRTVSLPWPVGRK